jgi:hypothetical protein
VKGLTPAERLLKDLGVTDPKEIDLEAVAWTLGARVKYRPLDGCAPTISAAAGATRPPPSAPPTHMRPTF